METWIIKLGGSVITKKRSKVGAVKNSVLRRLCQEIADFKADNQEIGLIVLHGAGSFGHPLAYKYGLSGCEFNAKYVAGASKTILSVRNLTNMVAETLQDLHLPAIPMQTSCMFYSDIKNNFQLTNDNILVQVMQVGGVPVLGGDITITADNHVKIASADLLATVLARRFKSKRIFFATDVDGVFASFPPQKTDEPLAHISKEELEKLIFKVSGEADKKTDVTGSMVGKLRALLPLQKVDVWVLNGLRHGNLGKALEGEPVGTVVRL
jgi:isopentenyl phosphate kinase